MVKIGIILGTRPEAIKLIPVYKEFKKCEDFDTVLISTGQHREMVQQIFDFFELRPDIDLAVMSVNQSLVSLSIQLMSKVDEAFQKCELDAIVVQGDTTTCMIASLVAYYHKIKVFHVEAGLRTGNKFSPYPEEINRKLTGSLSDFHFAPTQHAVKALAKENIVDNVYLVGNTVIDSLIWATSKVCSNQKLYQQKYSGLIQGYEKVVLLTGHRRENLGGGFLNICEAILELAHMHSSFSFIYPVHLNPNVREIVFSKLSHLANVHLLDPVPYDDMVYLMMQSYLIMTDSGGIQEEAPTLGKPVIVLRDTTERPEGVWAGCSRIAGIAKDGIVALFQEIVKNDSMYKAMSNTISPYGQGDASSKILEVTKKAFINNENIA